MGDHSAQNSTPFIYLNYQKFAKEFFTKTHSFKTTEVMGKRLEFGF